MNIKVAQIYAVLVGGLAAVGLFVSGHLWGIMNVDMSLDIIRLILVLALVYAGFIAKDAGVARFVLLAVGVLYVGMGIVAIATPAIGGLFPSGLTGFDIVFHLVTGAAALAVSVSGTKKEIAAAH